MELSAVADEVAKRYGVGAPDVLIGDTSDDSSLEDMAAQCRLVISCAGPVSDGCLLDLCVAE